MGIFSINLRLWALAGLMIIAQLPTPVSASDVIKIAGSGAGMGVMKQLAEAYRKTHPASVIRVYTKLGSAGAIKAVLQGAIDLAVSSRPLKDNETGEGVVALEYARTPFVFAAHKDVKKTGLSTREIERIYAGKVQRWPDGKRIRLVFHLESGTETEIINTISPGMAQAAEIAQSRQGMIHAESSDDSDEVVEITPGGLGVSTLAQIVANKRHVKILAFNGVKPSVKTLADGSYPLFKSLSLVTTAKTPTKTRQFIEFIRSAEGREIMARSGNLVVGTGKGR